MPKQIRIHGEHELTNSKLIITNNKNMGFGAKGVEAIPCHGTNKEVPP
jgi:hypothetical protein